MIWMARRERERGGRWGWRLAVICMGGWQCWVSAQQPCDSEQVRSDLYGQVAVVCMGGTRQRFVWEGGTGSDLYGRSCCGLSGRGPGSDLYGRVAVICMAHLAPMTVWRRRRSTPPAGRVATAARAAGAELSSSAAWAAVPTPYKTNCTIDGWGPFV